MICFHAHFGRCGTPDTLCTRSVRANPHSYQYGLCRDTPSRSLILTSAFQSHLLLPSRAYHSQRRKVKGPPVRLLTTVTNPGARRR